jgi:hypothetical protein
VIIAIRATVDASSGREFSSLPRRRHSRHTPNPIGTGPSSPTHRSGTI